jgi:MFS family permease
MWSVIFFFASAAASSAYLAVSEIFPFEMRALAIAVFYALGTAAGGVLAPWFFGMLIGSSVVHATCPGSQNRRMPTSNAFLTAKSYTRMQTFLIAIRFSFCEYSHATPGFFEIGVGHQDLIILIT